MSSSAGARLIVGVTGHRDLVDAEKPILRERMSRLLNGLEDRFADLTIEVVTSVASGADQLALEVADELGISSRILLAMPFDAMASDFDATELGRAAGFLDGRPVVLLSEHAHAADEVALRSAQHEYLGVYLAAHCHLLVAIWDGTSPNLAGGTAQIVDFHLTGNTVFDEHATVRSPIDYTEDESDLVFHILCSRTGNDTAADAPGTARWVTRDPEETSGTELPHRYARVFARQAELAAELTGSPDDLPEAVDALAVRYQRRTFTALFAAFALTGGAAASFVVYADLVPHPVALLVYGVLILAAIGAQQLARWREWQRKYVDYRGLAEALRTVVFWQRAGVRPLERSMFPHDHFLRRQELELGWIRNVLRDVGIEADAKGHDDEDELRRVCHEWGADQSSYYERARDRFEGRARILGRVSTACFVLGLIAVAVISIRIVLEIGENDLLIALMGILPLAAALIASYVYRLALRENAAQYSYMVRIHTNAARALAEATTDDRRRDILRALGEASLDENGLWLQRNRERPISHGPVSI